MDEEYFPEEEYTDDTEGKPEAMLDNDEVSAVEEAFMKGYEDDEDESQEKGDEEE